jgi:pimeloyl-ACP methyl ester carboxylesterase
MGAKSTYEFDFVDGAHPWPAHSAVAEVFGPNQAYRSYFDGSASSALGAVDDVAEYVLENGPFHAVMGFSMGGALAATVLLNRRDTGYDKPEWVAARSRIRCAVFLSATLPLDTAELQRGGLTWVSPADVGSSDRGRLSLIEIPTVHAWSNADLDNPGESNAVAQMCAEKGKVEILHAAGHGIPSSGNDVEAIASAIRKMISELDA